MMKMTIIMPFLNEELETVNTIKSIYDTAPKDSFEIIAIDDGSDKFDPSVFNPYPDVIYKRNSKRIGVDGSRQMGIEMAKTDNILIIDAHMRFKNDKWMETMLAYLILEPETLWCTTCLGLGYGTMDLNQHKGAYYGADMLFVDSNAKPDRPAREVLESKWASKKSDNDYEIPCVLGANYFMTKKWADYIWGLKGLKMWGTSEPFLSIKTWMAGGKCKITTDIEIGHKFRSNAPYTTGISYLVYNKIFMCKTIFPNELADKLIGYLPKDVNYKKAMELIEDNKTEIEEAKDYYQTIFTSSIYDYCNRFDIKIP